MSVLKFKRHQSKTQYVNVADQIFVETMGFLLRMSNRYQRLLAADTMKLASEVLDFSEKASRIKVIDDVSFNLKYQFLIQAKTSISALDVHMTHIWMLLNLNPQGCFINTKGKTLSAAKAQCILDKMANSLGLKIDNFSQLIDKNILLEKQKYQKG